MEEGDLKRVNKDKKRRGKIVDIKDWKKMRECEKSGMSKDWKRNGRDKKRKRREWND